MIARDARTVIALLDHLTAARTYDETDLVGDVLELHASAATALAGGSLPLDEGALLDTLCEVSQRFADGCYWGEDTVEYRPVDDVATGGVL